MSINGEFVAPGTKIGVIEQYISGYGTYVDPKKGYIYASIPGIVHIDQKTKRIQIIRKKTNMKILKKGDIVLGIVLNVNKIFGTIAIISKGKAKFVPHYTGLLHVARISRRYLNSIDDGIVEGDIIRAKIVDAKTIPVQLSTEDVDLGVIKAYCIKCGEMLKKTRPNELFCPACKNKEKRKTAINYGRPW